MECVAIVATPIDWKEGKNLIEKKSKNKKTGKDEVSRLKSIFVIFQSVSTSDEAPIPLDDEAMMEHKTFLRERIMSEKMFGDMFSEEIISCAASQYLGLIDNSNVVDFEDANPGDDHVHGANCNHGPVG
jgi:hypothetical protein